MFGRDDTEKLTIDYLKEWARRLREQYDALPQEERADAVLYHLQTLDKRLARCEQMSWWERPFRYRRALDACEGVALCIAERMNNDACNTP